MATCRGCGAEVVWVKSIKTGSNIICNPTVIKIVTIKGEVYSGRIIHWATCPKAKDFLKKKMREL